MARMSATANVTLNKASKLVFNRYDHRTHHGIKKWMVWFQQYTNNEHSCKSNDQNETIAPITPLGAHFPRMNRDQVDDP